MKSLRTSLSTAIAPVLWGTTYATATELLPAGSPLWTSAIRTLPVGLLLTLYFGRLPRGQVLGRVLALSLLNIGVFQALLFVAAYRLPGGIAAIFGAFQPILVLALCWIVDRMRPNTAALAAGFAGVAGIAAIVMSPKAQWDWVGIVAAAAGAVCMALGTYLGRKWRLQERALVMTGWQLLFGGILLLVVAIASEPPPSALTERHLFGYAYLTLIGTLLAYWLWFRGTGALPPATTASLTLLSPVTAVLLGWLLLGQRLETIALMGVVVVVASVLSLQLLPSPVPIAGESPDTDSANGVAPKGSH